MEICAFDTCEKPAAQRVRTVLGVERYCPQHAFIVREIEREWDEAEAEYLEQP